LCDPSFSDTPLPSGWSDSVRSAVIYVFSLAHYAITCARGWAANSATARVRLAAENDRLNQEIQLLGEELRIKNARMAKIDPHRRPYYPPTERMAILELKAARAWSLAQTAKVLVHVGLVGRGQRTTTTRTANIQASSPFMSCLSIPTNPA
jgi:hypothetical protein